MASRLKGGFWWVAVFMVALPVMTFAIGLPMSLALVAKQSRGALVAFVGWIVMVQVGGLPAAAGPFGVPAIVFWPLATIFGVWWAAGFVVMSISAWKRAVEVDRMMRTYGMPASEIF